MSSMYLLVKFCLVLVVLPLLKMLFILITPFEVVYIVYERGQVRYAYINVKYI